MYPHGSPNNARLHQDREECATAALQVVAAMPVQCTEHRHCVSRTASRELRQPLPFAGSGFPDNKDKAHVVSGGFKENATMAAVNDGPAGGAAIERLLGERGGCGSGDEARYNDAVGAFTTGDAPAVVEEAEQRRSSSVEGEVAAAEGGVAEEAAPRFAGEGGAHEDCGIFRRDA